MKTKLPKIIVPRKEIARLRKEGKTLSEICAVLDKLKVPTPSQERKWGKGKPDARDMNKRHWSKTAVWRIMRENGIR